MKDTHELLVTIGLCVRNAELTINENVESIVDLNFPSDKFELIVVDGQSTDNTLKIINEKVKDSNFETIILSDEGKGLSYARQIVVDKSKSKYIVWVDGDNVLPKDFLKSHVDYMEKNPDVGFSGVKIIPLGKSIVSRLQGYQWVIHTSNQQKAGYYMGKTGIQGTICRVDAIASVNGFDVTIGGAGEDVDLFIRMKLNGWKIGENDNAKIYHYMRSTWRGLWKESVWWGYGTSYITSKHATLFPSLKRRAGFAIVDCFKLTFKSLKETKDLACVIMPLHYGIRRLGFLLGHWHAHNDKYIYGKN